MPTRIPAHAVQLLVIMIVIKRHFFCWFLLSALSVLGIGLKREQEEERERSFLFTSFSHRRETKGGKFGKWPSRTKRLAETEGKVSARWLETVLGRTKCANILVKTYCLWHKQLENEIILGGHRAKFFRKWVRTLLFRPS